MSIRENVDIEKHIDEVTTAQMTTEVKTGQITIVDFVMTFLLFRFFYAGCSSGRRLAPDLRVKV